MVASRLPLNDGRLGLILSLQDVRAEITPPPHVLMGVVVRSRSFFRVVVHGFTSRSRCQAPRTRFTDHYIL